EANASAWTDHGAPARQELARAADADRHDRQGGAHRPADCALLELMHLAVAAARALGVEQDADPLRRAFSCGVDLFDRRVRILAVNDDVVAQGQGLAEDRELQQLPLGDKAQRDRQAAERAPDVEVAEVIAYQDVALTWAQAFEALDVEIDAACPDDPAAPQAAEHVDRATGTADQRGDDGDGAEDDGRAEDPRVRR